MEAIFILVPVSLAIVFGAIVVFLWAVKNEQFDDLDKEAERILFEEQNTGSDGRQTTAQQEPLNNKTFNNNASIENTKG